MQKLRILILFLLSISGATASAAAPASYYDDADGLYGQQLIRALCDIINTHTALSYGNVWTAYATTDLDGNGKVWDMYSTKRWNYGKEQCGNYSSIGSCYNREHSFPTTSTLPTARSTASVATTPSANVKTAPTCPLTAL